MMKNNRRMLIYLVVSNFFLYFGFRVWQSMFNNFAVEEIGVGALDMGLIQTVREIPGLIGFILGFVALYLSETRIMVLSVVMLGAGMFMAGQANTINFLLISTVVMSVGFHFFYPSNSGVVLMAVSKEDAPKTLGQLRSLGALAAVVAAVVVYLLTDSLGYRNLFMGVGIVVMVGGLLMLPMGTGESALPKKRQVKFRKKYWLYYLLSFLMGSRRHIFTTFAIFLLVEKYGIDVKTTTTLFLVNSLINTYALQAVGKWVARFGERVILSVAFGSLIFIFLGYAFIDSLLVLYFLFVLDNLLFGFNLALTTYFQKIAVTQEEITNNLSMEQTFNHIPAIIVPIVGGLVWEEFGSQAPFVFGTIIVTISLVLAQFIRTPTEVPAVAVAPAE